MTKRILCFGDSNTWGVIPRKEASDVTPNRYDLSTRWTSVMAHDLGSDWEIIEEGLGGRTTIFKTDGEEYRLGISYLRPCLLSHRPLDYIAIMLGTNDLEPGLHENDFDENDIAHGMEELIKIVADSDDCGIDGQPPKILLIAPPPIRVSDTRPDISRKYGMQIGVAISWRLAPVYAELAKKYNIPFIDSAKYAKVSSIDGIHLTEASHPRLGRALANCFRKLQRLYSENHVHEKLQSPEKQPYIVQQAGL